MYRIKISDIAELTEEVIKVEFDSAKIKTSTISSNIVTIISISGQISYDRDKLFMKYSTSSIAAWSLIRPGDDDVYKTITVEFIDTGEIICALPYAFVISYHEHFEDQNGFFKLVVKEVNPECWFSASAAVSAIAPVIAETPPEESVPNFEIVSHTHSDDTEMVVVMSSSQKGKKQPDDCVSPASDSPIVVKPPFKRYSPSDNPCDCLEFMDQLKMQEEGMNKLKVEDFVDNRVAFINRKAATGSGRHPDAEKAQQEARYKITKEMEHKVESGECSPKEFNNWKKKFKKQVALHNPDMVAGGFHNGITEFGHRGANSSIGSQWVNSKKDDTESLNRIESIEHSLFGSTLPLPEGTTIPKDTLMNVRLDSVCAKKPGCGKP